MTYAWFLKTQMFDLIARHILEKKYLIRENCHPKTCGGNHYLKSIYGAK